jgi:hypothetical protein
MAQKICPQCSHGMGPRSKSCPKCGYIYPHLQNGSSKKEAEYEDGNIKPGKGKCSNCSSEYESRDYSVDNYGTITYVFQFGHYCSYSCSEHASNKKDILILDLLSNIEDSGSIELKKFVEEKESDSELGPLIEDIFLRADSVKEEDDYRRTHPEIVLTSNPRKRNAPTSIEECEEVGIRPPPKISDFIPKEPEVEMNPLKAALLGIKKSSPLVNPDDENESEDEEELEEENEEQEEVIPSRPLTITEKFAQLTKKPIVPVPLPIVKPVQTNQSSTSYDSVSKPTQGQRKCGAKDRAKGLMVGCGKINGVKLKQCACGYIFP